MKKILIIIFLLVFNVVFAQKNIYSDLNVFGKTNAKDTIVVEKAIVFSDGSIQTIAGNGIINISDSLKAGITDSLLINTNALIVRTNGNVGIGTSSPNSRLDVLGSPGGIVGGFTAGQFQVTGSGTVEFSNSIITLHTGFNGNTQIAYWGSRSSGDNGITFQNRQNDILTFATNAIERVTIEAAGNMVLEKQLKIKGGTPGVNKILTSDVNGLATWEAPANVGNVVGPATSTNNALARFDLATGELIQNSLAILTDIGALSGLIQLTVDNIDINGNTISSTDLNGNINFSPNGTGDVIINSVLETVNGTNGTVGGFAAGNLMVRGSGTGINDNASISGHNSFGGNKQLWFLGSLSSSNDDVVFMNRQNTNLVLATNSITRVTIEDDGDVVFEKSIKIKGGVPDAGKVLTSDAVGFARWETVSVVGVTEANFFSATDSTTQTVAVANTFQTITFSTNDELDGWTHTAGTDAFTCNQTGKYRASVTMHLQKTGGVAALAEFRLTINGVPAGLGHTFVQDLIANNEIKLLTATNIVSLASGNVIRFEFTSNTTTTEIVLPVTTGANPVSIVAVFNRIQ